MTNDTIEVHGDSATRFDAVRDAFAGVFTEGVEVGAALAAQEPVWPPGARHGYHTNTQGFLIGEVVRRVDGRSLGAFLREEIGEPAGIDFHIGLPRAHHARVADLIPMAPRPADQQRTQPDNPAPYPKIDVETNSEAWRSAEVPSTNGHGNARALARLYGSLAAGSDLDGVRILEPATLEEEIR